ncbi:MAG: hypothetical protein CME57_03140 [Halieaceae bacterium]|nr:hypothetical protein [Halieaceae bacterium]
MSEESDPTTQSDVTSAELLGAVKRFLMEDVLPAVSGRDQFNARVAANVLGIIEREQVLNPALQALDRKAAQKWLSDRESTEDIPQQLARALAAKSISGDPNFIEYLKTRQLLVAAINNPRYASRAVAEARWG